MLFVIFVVAFIGAIFWFLAHDNGFSFTAMVLSGIAVIISIFSLCCNYIGIDAQIAKNDTRYETLAYQYENDIYDNDNDLGKYELMSAIQEWNEDVIYRQEIQDDFWIGVFYPNVYDHYKLIELESAT